MLLPTTILGRCAVGVKATTRTNHAPVRGVGLKAVTGDIGAKPCIAFTGRAMRLVPVVNVHVLCPCNTLLRSVFNFGAGIQNHPVSVKYALMSIPPLTP